MLLHSSLIVPSLLETGEHLWIDLELFFFFAIVVLTVFETVTEEA